MKNIVMALACLCALHGQAQELYPFTEPASVMPAQAISAKLAAMPQKFTNRNAWMQRYTPEIGFGISKKTMLHVSGTFSNAHSAALRSESLRVYAQHRFLSQDAMHRHLRMAVFVQGSLTRNDPAYDELKLTGDYSGAQAGLIATQLLHKLALSGSVSWIEAFHGQRKNNSLPQYPGQALAYSISAGYLLFPFNYNSYEQTNINLYMELLGNQNAGGPRGRSFIDLAPSVQAIFNSTGKLNVGYRFQVAGDMLRMAQRGWMISYEHLFLQALRKRPAR